MKHESNVVSLPSALPVLSRATLVGVGGEQGITIRARDGRTIARVATTVPIGAEQVGQEAVVADVEGDPVIIGVVRSEATKEDAPRVELDGMRLRFEAADEMEIVCGKASLVLQKDGTMTLKGTRIISRSSGLHSIFGANVVIN